MHLLEEILNELSATKNEEALEEVEPGTLAR